MISTVTTKTKKKKEAQHQSSETRWEKQGEAETAAQMSSSSAHISPVSITSPSATPLPTHKLRLFPKTETRKKHLFPKTSQWRSTTGNEEPCVLPSICNRRQHIPSAQPVSGCPLHGKFLPRKLTTQQCTQLLLSGGSGNRSWWGRRRRAPEHSRLPSDGGSDRQWEAGQRLGRTKAATALGAWKHGELVIKYNQEAGRGGACL